MSVTATKVDTCPVYTTKLQLVHAQLHMTVIIGPFSSNGLLSSVNSPLGGSKSPGPYTFHTDAVGGCPLNVQSSSRLNTDFFLQGPLLLWIHQNSALKAVLTSIRPAVAGLPLSHALWASKLGKTAFQPLVRGQTFLTGSCQITIANEMSLLKAQMTQVTRWRHALPQTLLPDLHQLP